MALTGYTEEILASGFPGLRPLPARARRAQLDGYVDRIVEREFAEHGQVVRRPATLRGWLGAYAAATSTTASYNAILDATAGESDTPARDTSAVYRDVLTQLWPVEPVPGWLPGLGAFGRLGQAPKHQLALQLLSQHGREATGVVTGLMTPPAVLLAVTLPVAARRRGVVEGAA